MLPISVCIITKNEEKFLESCLKKLSRYDWEIVVTDTGSTDHTLSIARKYTPKVYHFSWCDDFSAARNFCIEKASHDWILSVDSDEYLMNEDTKEGLLHSLSSCMNSPGVVGLVDILNPFSSVSGQSCAREPIGRFFHRKHCRYFGSIHEQPLLLSGEKPTYQRTPFSFYHEGYADPLLLQKKAKRNIQLLEASLKENPEDPYLYYQLGQSCFVLKDYEKACPLFQKGLSLDVDPKLQYVRTMVESYGHCLLFLKQFNLALSLEDVYEAFSSHADFVFLMGLIYMNNGLFEEAIQQFLLATELKDHSVEGINSYLPLYNIGVIYECLNMGEEALSYYRRCPHFPPAKEGIRRIRRAL